MKAIHRALRPGGELAVIDFRTGPGAGAWVNSHARGGEEMAVAEITGDGFRLVERSELLRRNYFLRFRKEAAR